MRLVSVLLAAAIVSMQTPNLGRGGGGGGGMNRGDPYVINTIGSTPLITAGR